MPPLPTEYEALPKYDRPPVAEVAIGVEFVPIAGLNTLRMLRTHALWEERYPLVREQAALPPSSAPGGLVAGMGLQLGFGATPLRLWMLANDERMLLQIQNDRLVLNWRRMGAATYPSYADLLPEFSARWEELVADITDLEVVKPIVAEVTYVNSIQPPSGSIRDLHEVSSVVGPLPGRWTLFQSRAQFIAEIPDAPGHTNMRFEPDEAQGTINLTVTSRVALSPSGAVPETSEVVSALHTAHAASVLGFTDITSNELHESWGRTR